MRSATYTSVSAAFGDLVEQIQTLASPSDRRRTIDYLRRKARSVELQAARAAPAIAMQLKSLAVSMQSEAEQLERAAAV